MHWWRLLRQFLPLVAAFLAGALVVETVSAKRPTLSLVGTAPVTFNLVPSTGAVNAKCLLNASATGTITPTGPVEDLDIVAYGLPPNVTFNVFIIQLPNAPFGMVWYQGDVVTDGSGSGTQRFVGIFSDETFTAGPGVGPAPVVFTNTPFPDASTNPATNPIQMYHVGLWFDSPTDAQAAGCPNTVTLFNGAHTAGIQALSTRTYANDQGPLRQTFAAPQKVALPAIFNGFVAR